MQNDVSIEEAGKMNLSRNAVARKLENIAFSIERRRRPFRSNFQFLHFRVVRAKNRISANNLENYFS